MAIDSGAVVYGKARRRCLFRGQVCFSAHGNGLPPGAGRRLFAWLHTASLGTCAPNAIDRLRGCVDAVMGPAMMLMLVAVPSISKSCSEARWHPGRPTPWSISFQTRNVEAGRGVSRKRWRTMQLRLLARFMDAYLSTYSLSPSLFARLTRSV